MTWTYSGDPSSDERDAVRFLIQDTDDTRQLATNEEIDWALTQEVNVYTTAAAVLEAVIYRQLGIKKKKIGDLSIEFGFEEARARLTNLRDRGRASYQEVTAGGISQAGKDDFEADTDRVKPFFKRKQMDFKGTVLDDDDPLT